MSESVGPEAMRATMSKYVAGLMTAYLDAARLLAPADRTRLPLLARGDLTVAIVGTRYLHIIGTSETLPPPTGPEVAIDEERGGLAWQLRFFDPVIIPALGLIEESLGPDPASVRAHLGIRTHLFHLVLGPGSGLTSHHAQHAGTGLAHAHASAVRDFEAICALVPEQLELVHEMHGAYVAGLWRAHALLAQQISAKDGTWNAHEASFDEVRSALLVRLRGR